jgi:PGF-pre-PGF domain-containing protein
LQVHINSSLIDSIAALENVEWIEKHHKPVLLNNNASKIMNVTTIHQNYSLNGSGQIIGIADTGLDTGIDDKSMHDDIEGRIINITSWGDEDASDTHGHGTHVAGSALGNGSLSGGKYSGTAPAAKLVFQAIGNGTGKLHGVSTSEDLFELLSVAYAKDARIHSNSWGNSNNSYTSYSQVADEFVWNHTDMLVLFAAGNDGENGNYTVGSPGTAKNILAIGATENLRPEKGLEGDNPNEIASFSSRGPTADGRIKPDLVAPGTWIISTRSSEAVYKSIFDENYAYMSGTSMATPLAAGTVALVRQYYMENLSINPSAALLKATLINGADDLGYNRTIQGWGRINLTASLFPPAPAEVTYYDNISLNTGETWQTEQYVRSNQTPLKATLVWMDHPGAIGADYALVNNLDFTITTPNGTVLYGNGGEGADRINNVEQILIKSPEKGTYRVRVNGTSVNQGSQAFSLVFSAIIDSTAPIGVRNLNETSTATTWINWTWTNPDDTDFNHTMIYLDGELKENISNEFYNATGLYPNTTYEIATRTVDVNGNINTTWQNDTATTSEDTIFPVIYSAYLDNYTPVIGETVTVKVNATDAESGIGNVTAFMDATAPSILLDYNTTSGNYTATFYAEYGQHSVNISVTDNASNTRWDNSTSYEGKDVTGPVIASVILDNYILDIGEDIALKVNVSDNIGIMNVTAYNGSMSSPLELTLDTNGNYTGTLIAKADLNTVNVSATDASGNTAWNNSTIYEAQDKPAGSNNEKGSSGGGGGSTTGEDYSNIKFKDFSIRSVKAELPITYNFEEKGNPVGDINLISSRNSGQVKLIIEILKNTSTLTNKAPNGTVYMNLNIWAGSSGFENHIRNSSVTFKVEKDWITQENIDIENVRMEVFEEGEWIALPTEYIEQANNYVHFKTATDNYLNSPFVISGSKKILKSNAKNENEIAEANNSNTQKTDINESVNNVSEKTEKNALGSEKIMDKMFTVWILIIAFIVRRKLV